MNETIGDWLPSLDCGCCSAVPLVPQEICEQASQHRPIEWRSETRLPLLAAVASEPCDGRGALHWPAARQVGVAGPSEEHRSGCCADELRPSTILNPARCKLSRAGGRFWFEHSGLARCRELASDGVCGRRRCIEHEGRIAVLLQKSEFVPNRFSRCPRGVMAENECVACERASRRRAWVCAAPCCPRCKLRPSARCAAQRVQLEPAEAAHNGAVGTGHEPLLTVAEVTAPS